MPKPRNTPAPPPETLERRVFSLERCEIRQAADGEPDVFSGYAAVFNELSLDLGGFRERIAPDCFDASLAAGADVRLLFNHDSNLILGRTKAGTLTVTPDEYGLYAEAPLPDTSYAHDLVVSMQRGDVAEMSFGFRATKDAWNDIDPETGLPIRDLLSADLFDVSPVCFPAYPQTTAEVRAMAVQARGKLAPDVPGLGLNDAGGAAVPPLAATDDPAPALAEPLAEPPGAPEARIGKMLSEKNQTTISDALAALQGAADALQALLDEAAGDGEEQASVLRPDFVAFLEQREWDWNDDYAVYVLTNMIAMASSFMVGEDEAAAEAMRTIMAALNTLLAGKIAAADLGTAAAEASAGEDERWAPVERLRLRLHELNV